MEGNLLLTGNGTEIVRYFGRELKLIVPRQIEVLGESCLEQCPLIARVVFEEGSRLRRICKSALFHCCSLKSISIPASVEQIDDAAFTDCHELESCDIPEDSILKRIGSVSFWGCQSLNSFCIPRSVAIIGEKCFAKCTGLESCKIDNNASLRRIEGKAFSECRALRSFYLPESVEVISEDCFSECCSLDRLVFRSGESFQKFVCDLTLDEALERIGFDEISSRFGIEIEDCGVHFEFPGWSSVVDESSHLILVPYIP
jgi:hypothetical protein